MPIEVARKYVRARPDNSRLRAGSHTSPSASDGVELDLESTEGDSLARAFGLVCGVVGQQRDTYTWNAAASGVRSSAAIKSGSKMTIEQLRNVHELQPFVPFTIHLADGRSFQVPHRDFLSHSPSGRTVIVYGGGEVENFSILDLLLVTEIEVHGSSSQAPGR